VRDRAEERQRHKARLEERNRGRHSSLTQPTSRGGARASVARGTAACSRAGNQSLVRSCA
jgi:hypothetical protein